MADDPFSLADRVAVITGGGGVLGGAIANRLAAAGATVAILDRHREGAEKKAQEICRAGGRAVALGGDVLDRRLIERACNELLNTQGRVDVLVNAAGGNVDRARNDDRPVFEVALDAFDEVLRLNLHGTIIPCLVFGEAMARQKKGAIVNISSMAALRATTGVLGYSVAKAGVSNATSWLAMDLARRYGEGIRVNAIAPGFFVSEQNRVVLLNPDGSPTKRTRTILAHTPMGRLGRPEEVAGTVQWLCSDAASFVTGVVIPIDGGFSAFGGV